MPRRKTIWLICCALVIALSVFTFTPIVLSQHEYLPTLFGLPRTLWMGILIAFLMVGVTFVGGFVRCPDETEDQE